MSIHRYSMTSILTDGLRAAFGLAVTLGPLLFLDPAWPLILIFAGLAAIFLFFAARLLQQCLSSIELSVDGIAESGPLARRLVWSDVISVKLAHYARPKHSSAGWYQLVIRGRNSAFKIDSTIDGFDDIVAAAARAAETSGLILDPVTRENLEDLKRQSCPASRDSGPASRGCG